MATEFPCDNCQFSTPSVGSSHHITCTNPIATDLLLSGKSAWVVEQDPHGVKNGWCSWPFDMDRIWIKSCFIKTPEMMKQRVDQIKQSIKEL